jgi:hypothetical protein
VLVLAALGVGAWYGFPYWYLNNSPHVIMQPKALASSAPVETEGNPQKADETNQTPDPQATLQIKYFDQKRETRIVSGFKQMDLPLPVVSVGVGESGDFHVAGVQVWMQNGPDQARFEREALVAVYTAWRMVPDLSEVDIWGVDRPDTKQRRGQSLCSLVVRRDAFVAANPRLSRSEQVHQLGLLWMASEQDSGRGR